MQVAGSNAPLRGGKGSNWEGGVRVPGFVAGGVVPPAMRGKTLDGLVHICDWFGLPYDFLIVIAVIVLVAAVVALSSLFFVVVVVLIDALICLLGLDKISVG